MHRVATGVLYVVHERIAYCAMMQQRNVYIFRCIITLLQIHGKHGKVRPRALKDLTKEHLKLEIQAGEHDPVSHVPY